MLYFGKSMDESGGVVGMPVDAAPAMHAAPSATKEPGASVAVFGLGFVGLPLSLSFAMEGSRVYGVDVVPALVDELKEGRSLHQESYQGRQLEDILREQTKGGRFTATLDGGWAVSQADTVIVTVGVPVTADGRPQFGPLTGALETIGKALQPGQIVILRATVVPGTTEDMAKPILEECSGLTAGVDFDLAYCPERIAEGRAFEEFRTMPTVIAGVTRDGAERARRALGRVTREITVTDTLMAAELSKVIENVQRDVNIAIVQELAAVCERSSVDVREVIALANTHKRVHLLDPGPGVGGYCIPNALHYLRPLAQRVNLQLPTLEAARSTNAGVPDRIAEVAFAHARSLGLEPSEARYGVWGLAMKDFTNDDRISPPMEIAHRLAQSGGEVRAFDPAVRRDHPYPAATAMEAAEGSHVLLVLARQEGMDFDDDAPLKALAPGALVLDTRGAYRNHEERIKGLGLVYWAI